MCEDLQRLFAMISYLRPKPIRNDRGNDISVILEWEKGSLAWKKDKWAHFLSC